MGRKFAISSYDGGHQGSYIEVGADGDELTTVSVQSSAQEKAILDANALQRGLRGGQVDHSQFGHHVARIPIELFEQWKRTHPELKDPDRKVREAKLIALINDPDFKNVRTSEASGGREKDNRSGNRSFGGL